MGKLIIEGTGEVYAKPDQAYISLTMETNNKSSADAISGAETQFDAIANVLSTLNIDKSQVKTTSYNLGPCYADQKMFSKSKITGWYVRHSLSVKLTDLTKLGSLLAQAAGNSQIDGLKFGNTNRYELVDQARQKAVKNAIHKAQLYAEAFGLKVKDEIEEISEIPQEAIFNRNFGYSARANSSGAPTFEGEQRHIASVKVVFRTVKDKNYSTACQSIEEQDGCSGDDCGTEN